MSNLPVARALSNPFPAAVRRARALVRGLVATLTLVLVLGTFAAPVAFVSCKPTYIDPVTGDEVACSTLPQVDLDYIVQLGIEFAMLIPDWGRIQERAITEGKIRGGCAIAALVDKFLAPPPGIAVPPPEQSVAARDALEATRKHFGGKVSWVNAKGQAL